MKIVSIINYKGGVGKTSVTSNIAAQMAWLGKKVLIVDLDPQCSLTFSFIKPDVWQKSFADRKTIKSWFESFENDEELTIDSLIHTPERVALKLGGRGKLDLIASHLGLINVDLELATELSGSSMSQSKKRFISVHRRLADGIRLDESLLERGYDVILIDCPPNFNIVTKTAIIASDYILVPTRLDFLSTLGIDYLIRSVNKLIKDYNEYAEYDSGKKVDTIAPKILGVLFTMVQEYRNAPISAQIEYMVRVKNMGNLYVFDSYIKGNSTLFANAPQSGIPVVLNAYSNVSHQSVVDGIEDATDEFIKAVAI